MGYREEYCDLTFDDIKTNTSVETASSVTIGRILDTMQYPRRLILAVVLKSPKAETKFNFNDLKQKFRKHNASG